MLNRGRIVLCRQTEKRLRARVPIIKFLYEIDGVEFDCDLCINNVLAVYNSALLGMYAVDPRVSEAMSRCPLLALTRLLVYCQVRQLVYAVKSWAKSSDVCSAPDGTFSSYAWTCMCIAYLQQTSPPVCPKLQSRETERRLMEENESPRVMAVDGVQDDATVWYIQNVAAASKVMVRERQQMR